MLLGTKTFFNRKSFHTWLRGNGWNENQLLVHKLFKTKIREFFAATGTLNSAERQIRRTHIGIVDEHHLEKNLRASPMIFERSLKGRADHVRNARSAVANASITC